MTTCHFTISLQVKHQLVMDTKMNYRYNCLQSSYREFKMLVECPIIEII